MDDQEERFPEIYYLLFEMCTKNSEQDRYKESKSTWCNNSPGLTELVSQYFDSEKKTRIKNYPKFIL